MKLDPVRSLIALLALAGCGRSGASLVDGGVVGTRSFDVTAALSVSPDAGIVSSSFPMTSAFTLVLDEAAARIIVGGKGRATAVPVAAIGGQLRASAPFSVGVLGSACGGATEIDYTSFAFGVSSGRLSGHAGGVVHISCGDCAFDEPFVAEVAGVPDATPPLLFTSGAGAPVDPFQRFSVVASEPLPATATARLVASDGSPIGLVPDVMDGAVPLVTGFSKPDVVLPFGQGYVVAFDGLVDFAGLRGSSAAPLRLASFETPPLIPEDGFESATGAAVGGATVVTAAPFAPLAGGKSVYVGVPGAPSVPGVAAGTSMRVRLAVSPGDTKLKFSYRVYSNFTGGFTGTIVIGSVGHAAGPSNSLPLSDGLTQVPWPGGAVVLTSGILSDEIALPADVGAELLVAFETASSFCGPPQAPAGVLIDDLRVE